MVAHAETGTAPALTRDDAPDWRFALREGVTRVGRDSGSDLRIDAPWIAPEHCVLVRLGNRVRVHGRAGDTLADGQPARGQLIGDGACIRLGKLELRVVGATTPQQQKEQREQKEQQKAQQAAPGPLTTALRVAGALAAALLLGVGVRALQPSPAPAEAVYAAHAPHVAPITQPAAPAQPAEPAPSPELAQPAEPAPVRFSLSVLDHAAPAPRHARRADPARLREQVATLSNRLTATLRDLVAVRADRDRYAADLKLTQRLLRPVPLGDGGSAAEATDDAATSNANSNATPGSPDAGAATKTPDKPAAPPELRPERLNVLAARICAHLDNHANPTVTAERLMPPLFELVGAGGDAPTARLLALIRHARALELRADQRLRTARMRVHHLRAELRDKRGKTKGLIGTGRSETKQRELDMYLRLADLREAHLKRLRQLTQTLMGGVRRLAAHETAAALAAELTRQAELPRARRDQALVEAALRRLADETVDRRTAASALIDHLSIADRRLRAEVRHALLALVSR